MPKYKINILKVLKGGNVLVNVNLSKKITLDKIAIILFYFSVLTSSFDIFLVFNINNLSIRISQIVMGIFIIFTTLIILIRRKVLIPKAFIFLLIWGILIFIFSFNSYNLLYNISYTIWLIFNIFVIITVVNFFNIENRFRRLYIFYIKSFFYIALFGLFEFVLGILRIHFPLITEWWIDGKLPRINGFSYEPSYFATYLIMGWVILAYLIKSKSTIISIKKLRFYYYVETLSIILSSSRMGILMIGLWYLQYPLKVLTGIAKNKISKTNLKIIIMFIIIVFVVTILGFKYKDTMIMLLNGTGLLGTGSHSVDDRNNGFYNTLLIFKNHMFLGVGLGGVNLEIAKMKGVTNGRYSNYTGFCVFAEVLAASGIFGFAFFAIYIVKLIINSLNVSKNYDADYGVIVKSLGIAFIFELIILQFNQNILRPYLWIHIAILSCSLIYNKKNRKLIIQNE